MNLFYSARIEGPDHILDAVESRHAVRVLRLRSGDRVYLVDGRGGWYEAVMEVADPKRCRLQIQSHTSGCRPLPYHLHLAVSPTKQSDRFEWFLEKATEIGVTEVTPCICRRSERTRIHLERLERIAVSAMKQSLRAWKPLIREPMNFGDFIGEERTGTLGIAHCDSDGDAPNRIPVTGLPRNPSYTLLVGPEGDFTEEEVHKAVKAGYAPFHLGSARLRTETAAVHICSAVSLMSDPG